MFKKYIVLFIAIAAFRSASGLTKEQLKKTVGLMKKPCMSKSGATEDKIANIGNGEFLEEESVKCYVMCIYKTGQVDPYISREPEIKMHHQY